MLKPGKMYKIQWKGEPGYIKAIFKKVDRGFYIFQDKSGRVVCKPDSVIIGE